MTAEEEIAEFAVLENRNPPRNSRRPWGYPRSDWFHLSREFRARHFWCCHEPLAQFFMDEADAGKGEDWWMRAPQQEKQLTERKE